MNFTKEQIIWIQEWLAKMEQNFETAKEDFRRELFLLKKESTDEADPYMGTDF